MEKRKLLYRSAEAAETLGVSRPRLYQLMAAGELGSVKIGASRRVPAVDLEAYVSRLRSQDGAAAEKTPAAERTTP
jgi:excisionase family DNA binding protein